MTPRANTTIWSQPGKQRSKGSEAIPKTSGKAPSADEIAEMASREEDVSAYFTNKFTVIRPIHRANVDLTQGMLRELDKQAARLNISRQAVIKTILRHGLDERRGNRQQPKKRPRPFAGGQSPRFAQTDLTQVVDLTRARIAVTVPGGRSLYRDEWKTEPEAGQATAL